MALVMAVAAALRLANLGHNSLTHDECVRATYSYNGDLDHIRWFPPGQLAIWWVLQHWVSRSEWVLRLPVALLGILAVFLCFSITRRRIGDWAAVFASAYLAFNYHAIFYSRAAKEIGYEPALTLLLIWAGARAADCPRRSHIVVFFGAAVLGLLLGFSPIMVATAWGPLILWSCRRDKHDGRRSLRLFLLLTAAFVPIVLAWYSWLNGSSVLQRVITYIGESEQVSAPDSSPVALASWVLANSFGLLRFVSGVLSVWQPAGAVLLTIGVFLALAGIGELWGRWPTYVKFACLLLAVNIALGVARKWPYGDSRMSVFLLPVFAPLFGCGLACVVRRLRSLPAGAFLLLVWFGVAVSPAAHETIVQPREYDHVRPVLKAVQQKLRPGDAMLVYYAAGWSFDFYWSDSRADVHVQDIGSRGRLDLFRTEFDALAREHPRVWVFFTHVYGDEGKEWSAYALQGRRAVHRFNSVDSFAYCVETGSKPVS